MTAFAMLFPGQGSQAVGMLDAWGERAEVVRTLTEASDALGEDLRKLIHAGPKDQLDLTVNTQPVMLVAGIACYRAWIAETGIVPRVVAGHSLGEYSALVAAGALMLRDAVRLVRFRATAMQDAVPAGQGGMAVILGLDAEAVREGCLAATRAVGAPVEAVNFNDPKQTVIAGARAAVDKACELLKAAGAKRTLVLPVSAPFHSSLMRPAAEALRKRLASTAIATPSIAVINNIDLRCESEPNDIRDALTRQACGPVRWVELVQSLRAQGVTHMVECGPGKVLSGLVKRIDANIVVGNIFDPDSLQQTKGLLA